jgi:ketosteroid isomerase-like protein
VSQENVEKLRYYLEQWSGVTLRPEARPGEAFDLTLLDPDVVYEDANLPDHAGEPYRGHEGVVRAMERWIEPFEWMVIDLKQLIDADDLVSIHRWRGKAQHTGIEFEWPLAYLWTFRDGKVIHFRSFLDPNEALKAVGLDE